jgi:hypothetical protein
MHARRRSTSITPAVPADAAEAARLGRLPEDSAFLTGNGLAARCGRALNYEEEPAVHADGEPDWWFCKLDRLDEFLARQAPRRRFVLVTHNSDYPVDDRYRRVLRRWRVRAWLAANVAIRHPKLIPVPLGIANPSWEHGDVAALHAVQADGGRKTTLVDVSFSVDTNPAERRRCLDQAQLDLAPRLPYGQYLVRLASAYFCLSPRGHGIDTHRTWEALYVRTVPVVTRSALTDAYPDLPWIVLDDWSEFPALELSAELYERIMGRWEPSALSLDSVVELMRQRVGAL